MTWRWVCPMVEPIGFVDEGLGNSSYLVDLGPHDWVQASGRRLESSG